MKNEVLARRYAEALFESVHEHAEAVDTHLTRVADALATPQAQLLLTHPKVRPDDKKSLLGALCGDGADGVLRNFLAVVVDHRREHLIPEIAELFHQAVLAAQGKTEAVIETAHPLDDAERERTVAALGRMLGLDLAPRFDVVPELIGGVRARFGHRMVDGSVLGNLEQLRHQLMRGEEVGA